MGFLRRSKTPKGPSSPQLPSYDSICPPNNPKKSEPVSTDEKKPLSILASLRNNVTANHAAQSEQDAISRRTLLDEMVKTTHFFLSEYRSSACLKACLSFIPPPWYLVDGSSYTAKGQQIGEFRRNKLINTAILWDRSDVAKALAKDLKARLEEELGDFIKTKQETNVELTVVAEKLGWHFWRAKGTPAEEQKTTKWRLAVKVQIIDAKMRSR